MYPCIGNRGAKGETCAFVRVSFTLGPSRPLSARLNGTKPHQVHQQQRRHRMTRTSQTFAGLSAKEGRRMKRESAQHQSVLNTCQVRRVIVAMRIARLWGCPRVFVHDVEGSLLLHL